MPFEYYLIVIILSTIVFGGNILYSYLKKKKNKNIS